MERRRTGRSRLAPPATCKLHSGRVSPGGGFAPEMCTEVSTVLTCRVTVTRSHDYRLSSELCLAQGSVDSTPASSSLSRGSECSAPESVHCQRCVCVAPGATPSSPPSIAITATAALQPSLLPRSIHAEPDLFNVDVHAACGRWSEVRFLHRHALPGFMLLPLALHQVLPPPPSMQASTEQERTSTPFVPHCGLAMNHDHI